MLNGEAGRWPYSEAYIPQFERIRIKWETFFFNFTEKSEDELEEICRLHYLPMSILQLKVVQPEDTEGGALPPQYGVFTLMPLPKGSSFGPFKAMSSPSEEEEKSTGEHRCVLQVPLII